MNSRWKRKSLSLVRAYRNYGINGILSRVYFRIFLYIKGVDFSREPLKSLNESSENIEHGTEFSTTTKHGLEISIGKISLIESTIFDGTFIDYGSGKGLTLYVAHKLGFRNIVGIEFMEKFCNVAENNLRKLLPDQTNISIIHIDASLYPPPPETRVVFLFNPFDDFIMKKVIQNLKSHHKNLYVIYYNSVFRELFLSDECITLVNVDEDTKTDIYFIKSETS
jgi:hypothetical protein